MNFAFTSEQEALRAEARRFLGARVDLRAQIAMPGAHDPELWNEIAALGWLEEMPLIEECIILEETGRALLPGPFLARRLHPEAPVAPIDSADLTRARFTERGEARATLLLAAESVGVAARALDDAVAYAKEREQFGRPIGSFQAIKHKAADMLRSVEAARLAVYAAACDVDDAVGVAIAKVLSNDAALRCTKENIQIHGGIGVTWEHDAHLLYRRALANSVTFGDNDHTIDRIAQAVLAE